MRSLRCGTLHDCFGVLGTHSSLAEFVPRFLDVLNGTKDVQHTQTICFILIEALALLSMTRTTLLAI
jgi:hypothetical protein